MTAELTEMQHRLCEEVQSGLPICERPFEELAQKLGGTEGQILKELQRLKAEGILRRFGAIIDWSALGLVTTLVTSHIEKQQLDEVAGFVNALPEVSHNYLREHFYNLWFTLQGCSFEEINRKLAELSGRLGTEFHSVPAICRFKLDVWFGNSAKRKKRIESRKEQRPIVLDDMEKMIVAGLLRGLSITERPFDLLCPEEMNAEKILDAIKKLIVDGVIRRIAGIVDHRKFGFLANVLFAAKVEKEKIGTTGRTLADMAMVSHCYERATFEGWPYNLYAMLHGRSMAEVLAGVEEFCHKEQIEFFQLLPTAAELKKEPVKPGF